MKCDSCGSETAHTLAISQCWGYVTEASRASDFMPFNECPYMADSVEKVGFSGNVTLSLASSKNLFTTAKWLFGTSLTVAALSVD